MNGFIHWPTPVNWRINLVKLHAQRRREDHNVVFGDVDCAAFDFGNGAAGGVVPAGVIQLDSKSLLRPAVLLAQLETFPKGTKRDLADALVQVLLYVDERYVFKTPANVLQEVAAVTRRALDATASRPAMPATAKEAEAEDAPVHPEDYASFEHERF